MDVSALYTNILTQEGISASRSFLQDKITHEVLDDFCDLINIVLIHNNFTFDSKHFRQLFGTLYGFPFSWVVLKKLCCSGSPRNPSCGPVTLTMFFFFVCFVLFCFFFFVLFLFLSLFLFCFCFCLFVCLFFFVFLPHGPDDLEHFVNFCNTFHPTIKFTSESSTKEIPFLDAMVSIKYCIDSTLICTLNPLIPTSSFTGHPVTPKTLRQAFHTVWIFASIGSAPLKNLSRRELQNLRTFRKSVAIPIPSSRYRSVKL